MIDLHGVVVLDHTTILKFFMDLVFSQSVLDVVIFYLVRPAVVKVVDFTGYLTAVLKIKRLIHLREAALAQDREYQVLVVEDSKGLLAVDAAVLGLLFITNAFVFNQVGALLLFKHLKLLLDTTFFVLEQLHFELVDLSLLILINVVEFTLFEVEL